MTQTIWTPRMTVSAVIERDNKFLIVEEIDDGQQVFNQPAGHLEDKESLIDAIEREVLEETGFLFTASAFTGLYRWSPPHLDLTFMRVNFIGHIGAQPVSDKLDNDIIATHWLSASELEQRPLRSPLVMRCIEDYLQRPHYPLDALIEQS
ncbi:MAG: NUDIX hydrolase [Granulosicoccaceae bacterium]